MYDAFCYGAISLDISGKLERPMRDYEQATAVDYAMSPGGDATLVSLTLSSLGLNVGLAGSPVGDDPMGDYIFNRLEKEDVKATVPKLGKTAMTAIVLDRYKRSTITFHDNTPEERIPIPEAVTDARLVYVDGCFDRNSKIIARRAREKGIKALLNFDIPSKGHIGLFDIVISGERASKVFSEDPVEAARKIYEANDGLAIVTLGELGCVCCDGAVHHVPAFEAEAVDTTGCGAAFAAGLIFASLKDMPLEQCLEFASAAGAIKASARGSYVKLKEREIIDYIESRNK